MAITTANVYRCSITQKSLISPPGTLPPAAGYGNGTSEQIVVAQNPASVVTVLQTQFGADLLNIQGPVLIAAGAWLSGAAALAEAPPEAPPAEEPVPAKASKNTNAAHAGHHK
jgi:hypothetical protein